MQKIWQVVERLDDSVWQHILKSRDLADASAQELFFSPNLEQLISPWDFPDMKVATERIMAAITAQESIVVWGDFDADGVTSTAIVWETLHDLGAKVLPYIPNRDNEGHGFSPDGLRELADRGTKLLITVDHGVTAFDEVEAARDLGMEVIISDHHEPIRQQGGEAARQQDSGKNSRPGDLATSLSESYDFPEAVAVIHPFRLASPQKLAGCGVAYQLAYAVWLAAGAKQPESSNDSQPRNLATSLPDTLEARQKFAESKIELAALGTIADMMPLLGDNRVLAYFGLEALAKTSRVGLQQMYDLAGLKPESRMSVYEVGFVVGPRLNAPGRLADALASLRLLCIKNAEAAKPLAVELDALNTQRQDLLARVLKEAKVELAKREGLGAYVLRHKDWPAGVCGLAAGRLVEQVYRPVVVMEDRGEYSRGSARSIKGFDITAALTEISDLLEHFGGHAMAAGFECKTENVAEVEQKLSAMVIEQLSSEQLQPKLSIDADLNLSELTLELVNNLKKLEPCGMDNPQPIFVSYGVQVAECRAIGKEGKHLKLRLQDSQIAKQQDRNSQPRNLAASPTMDAVAFGFGYMTELLNETVDVAYTLEENVWNGKTSLQLKVKDIRLAEAQ